MQLRRKKKKEKSNFLHQYRSTLVSRVVGLQSTGNKQCTTGVLCGAKMIPSFFAVEALPPLHTMV